MSPSSVPPQLPGYIGDAPRRVRATCTERAEMRNNHNIMTYTCLINLRRELTHKMAMYMTVRFAM